MALIVQTRATQLPAWHSVPQATELGACAVSFFTRRRSSRISCRSSGALRSITSRLTTTCGAFWSHLRAVERRTPRPVAMVTSPVRWRDHAAGGHNVAAGEPWS
jgi:hypothetical protein